MSRHPTNLSWLALRWPREIEADQLMAVFRLLAASAGSPIILEAVGTDSGVDHCLAVRSSRSVIITEHLRAALPGIGITELDAQADPGLTLNRAIKPSPPATAGDTATSSA